MITSFYYRVYDQKAMATAKGQFPDTQLFRVEDQFGGWPQVMKTHPATGGELISC